MESAEISPWSYAALKPAAGSPFSMPSMERVEDSPHDLHVLLRHRLLREPGGFEGLASVEEPARSCGPTVPIMSSSGLRHHPAARPRPCREDLDAVPQVDHSELESELLRALDHVLEELADPPRPRDRPRVAGHPCVVHVGDQGLRDQASTPRGSTRMLGGPTRRSPATSPAQYLAPGERRVNLRYPPAGHRSLLGVRLEHQGFS